jgi:hypothetical protein
MNVGPNLVGKGQHRFIESINAGQIVLFNLDGVEETGITLWSVPDLANQTHQTGVCLAHWLGMVDGFDNITAEDFMDCADVDRLGSRSRSRSTAGLFG